MLKSQTNKRLRLLSFQAKKHQVGTTVGTNNHYINPWQGLGGDWAFAGFEHKGKKILSLSLSLSLSLFHLALTN
jgi:hypothetical protein